MRDGVRPGRGGTPRRLSVWGLAAITFFCVSGGAYGFEPAVRVGGPLWALAAMLLIPWFWSLPCALMTAELSAALPDDGGAVVWVEAAFGPFAGFQAGWWSWLCSFADNALYPVLFTTYGGFWLPHLSAVQFWCLALSATLVVTGLNVRGIQLAGSSAILLSVAALAPFLVMVLLGLPHIAPWALLAHTRNSPSLPAIGVLLSVTLWNYGGWDNTGNCAGEVNDPGRSYPRAMVLALVLVILTYLLPTLVGVSDDRSAGHWVDGYYSVVAARIGGKWLGAFMAVGGMASALGLYSAMLCASARLPFSLAERRLLPRFLARVHARYGTPWTAIVVNSVLAAFLIGWARNEDSGPFVALLQLDMWLSALSLVLEYAALVYLRLRQPALERPYRMPGGLPGMLALVAPALLLCAGSMLLCPRQTQAVGSAGVLLGLVVYAWFGSARRRQTWRERMVSRRRSSIRRGPRW